MAWSYSSINTYDTCPRRYYYMYEAPKGTLPREAKSEQQLVGDRFHEAAKKALRLGDPMPEEFRQWQRFVREVAAVGKPMHVELKLGMREDGSTCEFFAPDVWGRGTLDVVFVDATHAWIGDWKTGKVREDPLELAIQAVLLKAKWPSLERITGSYIWLRDDAMGTPHDLSNTEKVLARIRDTLAKIDARQKTSIWPPDEGVLCGWCPVTKDLCEHKRDHR